FDTAEVRKERGVVVEEWRLGRGAGARIRDRQFPVLFAGSRYAERLPIGDPEVIRTAPVEAIRRFYHDWYRPDLMSVVAVGDFDPRRVEAMIRERFGRIPARAEARTRASPSSPTARRRARRWTWCAPSPRASAAPAPPTAPGSWRCCTAPCST